jgi:hypothetical protein
LRGGGQGDGARGRRQFAVRMGENVGLRFVAKRLHFFDEKGLALM